MIQGTVVPSPWLLSWNTQVRPTVAELQQKKKEQNEALIYNPGFNPRGRLYMKHYWKVGQDK